MNRRIFIGDIHGEEDQLRDLLDELNLKESDEIIFMGDYIDKGDRSKGVLDTLYEVCQELPQTRLLWGNHDLMFYEWLTNQNPVYEHTYEGLQTIKQFIPKGIHHQLGKVQVLKEYKWLFDKMESHIEYPEQVAVHGGLNLTKGDPVQDTNLYEKANTRMFMSGNTLNKPIIVGHTPKPAITITKDRKMVNIDTGCGTGGYLSALIYLKDFDLYTDSHGYGVDVLPLSEW